MLTVDVMTAKSKSMSMSISISKSRVGAGSEREADDQAWGMEHHRTPKPPKPVRASIEQ